MKKFLKIFGAIIALLILIVIGLVMFVDANQFKPSIESIAKKQGIALQIKGNLSWKLWPSLGVGAEGVDLGSLDQPDIHLAQIENMSFLLAVRPLFAGKLQADHLLLSGVTINLLVDAKGNNNWSFLSNSNTSASAPEETNDSSLNINVNKISIEKSSIAYIDQQAEQQIHLTNFNLQLSEVNTQEIEFPISLSTDVAIQSKKNPETRLGINIKNNVKLDKDFKSVSLSNGELQLVLLGTKSVTIPVAYDVQLNDVKDNMTYKGHFSLVKLALDEMMRSLDVDIKTANPDVLSALSISSSFSGDDKKINLDDLQLTLDNTQFKGAFAVTDFTNTVIKLDLQGDKINLDDYLPPETDKKSEVQSSDDTPLPFEPLRSLNLNAKVRLQELIISKLKLTNLAWKLIAKNGMLEQQLDGSTYSGKLNLKSQLDARSNQAQLKFDTALDSVQLQPLFDDLFEYDKEKFNLQGGITLRALGSSTGATVNQVTKNLQSNATFTGTEIRMAPINLQKQFCKLTNLVNKVPATDREWDEYTNLTEVSGNIKLKDEKILIDSLKAGVESLILNASGKIDMAADKYDFLLPFSILKSTSVDENTKSCMSGDTYWMEKGMSLLRCKGKLSDLNPADDCRPDKELLLDVTKSYAEYKLKQKYGEKIDAKKQEINDKKQEVKEKLNDKKKSFLDKLQKKLVPEEKNEEKAEAVSE